MTVPPLVTFWLSEIEYAFDVSDVVEMTPAVEVTRVPGTTDRVAGVTNWRGTTIPVLDLAAVLKVKDGAPDQKRRLLVLGRPGPFGILIERPGRIVPPGGSRGIEVDGLDADHEAMGGTHLVRTDEGIVRLLHANRLIGNRRELITGEPLVPFPETLG